MRFPACAGAALAASALPLASARADDEGLKRQVDDLVRRMKEMDERHRAEMDALRRQLDERGAPAGGSLQEQIDRLVDEVDDVRAKLPTAPAARPVFRLVELSLNSLVTAGTSSAPESTIATLQQGGHDPQRRGVTVQNVELVLSGAVDPYFNAQANVITLIDPEGETVVELEEAFATTTSLPAGLQAKAGQFLSAFGRHNAQHPHQWDFVDAPVANTRILGGDGMRGPGVQLSWLGASVPLELTGSVQNANGETMASFLAEDPPVGRPVEREVRSFGDTAVVARAAWSQDLTEEVPFLLGVSGAWGPSGSSEGDDARVLGADATLKWRPLTAEAGFPFVALRAEWLGRRYEFERPGGLDELEDSGWNAQAVWGFRRDWTAGVRYDHFEGGVGEVAGLDDRTRWSVALTWFASEFSRVRLQVNRDRADSLSGPVTSVWLQLEFNLGQHGAHRF